MGKATASVAVLYASDYGFSDRLSQTLARGITKAGVATDMVDLLSVDPQVCPVFTYLCPEASGHRGFVIFHHHRCHRVCEPWCCGNVRRTTLPL